MRLEYFENRLTINKFHICGVNQIAVYQYIFQKDNAIGTYSNFKKYLNKHNLKPNKSKKDNKRKINPEFKQFVKDMGTDVTVCKPRTPETKGKDETCNKFMTWLIPYNHEFEDEKELIEIIEKIRNTVNATVNQTTNVPPILLFEKEKEHLLPVPNNKIMLSYLEGLEKSKVFFRLCPFFKK